jgi:putative MATE family efflux protein
MPTWKLVLMLGWPALVQQLLIFAVMLFDAWLAGWYGDVAAQSAQTTATYLNWTISSYAVLVSVGGTALVARFIGAEDVWSAVRVTNQALVLAAGLGVLGSVAGQIWGHELMALLQLKGKAADLGADYLRPIFIVLPFQMLLLGGIACLAGAGDTRTGLWVLGGIALLNMPLAAYFRSQMGFTGIAVGTAASNLLGSLVVLVVLARGRAGLRLRLSLLWPDLGLIRRLLRISIPAGLDSLLVAVGQLCFLSIVNRLSEAESGAHGIALRWEALAFLAGTAFGTAAMTMVGQNLGAGDPERAARSGWSAFGLCCLVMCLCGVIFVVLAPQMFALFCPRLEQEPVIDAGVPVLRLIAVAMPPLAATIVFTAALRGAGDTRVPVLFTMIGFFLIRLPLAWVLTSHELDLGSLGVWRGAGLGLIGAWIAMAIDVFARGGFLLLRFAGGRWRGIEV